MLGAARLHYRKLLAYGILSVLDLLLTWRLVQASGGQIYESNPVASAWLSSYGWQGLILFKASMVVLIGVVVLLISLHRPDYGGRILIFACSVTAAVVLYSFYLSQFVNASDNSNRGEETANLDGFRTRHQLECRRHDFEYLALVDRLSDDLSCNRTTLLCAVNELAFWKYGKHPRAFQRAVGDVAVGDRERLALALLDHMIVAEAAYRRGAEPDLDGLRDQFQTIFGRPLPPEPAQDRVETISLPAGTVAR
jgi:hypothetical protein